MSATSGQSRKLACILVFFFTFLLIVSLSLPWVSAEEKPKPKPKDWEIKGIVAALKDPYAKVRLEAASKLGEYELDQQNKQILYKKVVNQLVKQLSPPEEEDKEEKSLSRRVAAYALGEMKAKEIAPDVAKLLQDSDSNLCFDSNYLVYTRNNVCNSAVKALLKMGKQDLPGGLPVLVQVLDAVYKYPSEVE